MKAGIAVLLKTNEQQQQQKKQTKNTQNLIIKKIINIIETLVQEYSIIKSKLDKLWNSGTALRCMEMNKK